MAAIVQDDPYQCLIRKIGYSVGLEILLDRVLDVTECYVESRKLNYAIFKELVIEKFERDKSHQERSVRELANVYGSLNLLKLQGRKLRVLPYLEALSILKQYFSDEREKFSLAAQLVLLHAIIENDGDIFVNALEADFKEDRFKKLLENMLETKWTSIKDVIKSPSAQRKISDIINIKSQESVQRIPTSEQGKSEPSRFTKRDVPLSIRRATPLSKMINRDIDISAHYLENVSGTRKKWAEDLGLSKGGVKTEKGIHLLAQLNDNLGLRQDSGCYVIWPYSDDLMRIRIKPSEIRAKDLNQWSILTAIAQGTSGISKANYDTNVDYSHIIDLLEIFYRYYRESNESMRSIKHQFPLYIIYPCLVAYCVAKSEDIPPLLQIFDSEYKKDVRRINRIIIRGTEGGVFFNR